MKNTLTPRQKGLLKARENPFMTFWVLLILACALGPISWEWGSLSFSLQTFFILLPLYLLPHRWTLLWVGVYLLLGFSGIPVFSGYTGGWEKINAPSVGFLAAFWLVMLFPYKRSTHPGVDAFYRHLAILAIGFGYLFIRFGYLDVLYIASFLPWALLKSWALYGVLRD